eukprot:764449-Hanusia_phi.AAC.8
MFVNPSTLLRSLSGFKLQEQEFQAGLSYIPFDFFDQYGNTIESLLTVEDVESSIASYGPISLLEIRNSFFFFTNITKAGKYQISIIYLDIQLLYWIVVGPGEIVPENSLLEGLGVQYAVAGSFSNVTLKAKDRFGNPVGLQNLTALQFSTLNCSGSMLTVDIIPGPDIELNYFATFPTTACQISVKIDGKDVKNSPFFVRVWPAPAPRILSATYQPDLAGAIVIFDSRTDRGNLIGFFSCKYLLEIETIARLGSDSKCVWTSDQSFAITFGDNHTALPGTLISIQKNLLRSHHQDSFYVSSQGILSVPNQVLKLTPILRTPLLISPCDDLELDPTPSYGAGIRQANFKWTVRIGPTNYDAVNAYLSALPQDAYNVVIPQEYLIPGTRYVFSLEIQNFLQQRAVAQYDIQVSEQRILPGLLVIGQPEIWVYRSSRLFLEGKTKIPSCSGAVSINYSWSQIDGIELISWPAPNTVHSTTLYLPPNTLQSGYSYVMRLSLGVNTSNLEIAYSDIRINVISSNVYAVIEGGNRTISSRGDLVLNASGSHDPDEESYPFVYFWDCLSDPCFDDPEGILLQNSPVITIPSSKLVADRNLTFKLQLIKDPGPRSSSASVMIYVSSELLPEILVTTNNLPYSEISPDNRLVLTSRVMSSANESCTPSYEWSLISGDIDLLQPQVRTTTLFSPNLVLRPNVLVQNQEYIFELRVTCETGSLGTSRIGLLVREPPRGGILTVTPTSGYPLQTYFLIKAIGWLGLASEFPLSYLYKIKSGNIVIQLSSLISDNQLQTTVPELLVNNSDTVYEAYVVICDLWQSCVESKTVPIQISKTVNDPQYGEYLDSFIKSASNVGDSVGVVTNSLNLLYLMHKHEITPARRASTNAPENIEYITAILQVLNDTYHQTAGSYTFITFISAPMLQVATLYSPTMGEVHFLAMSVISELVNGSEALDIIQDVAAQNLFDAVSGIINKMSKDFLKEDALFNNTLLLVEDSVLRIGTTILIGHVPYENPIELNSSEILLVLKRLAREQMNLIPTITSHNCFDGACTSLLLSPSIPGTTIDIHLLVWNGIFHPLVTGQSISNQTSIQVTENRLLRTIPYVEVPIHISMPILATIEAENVPTCRFWELESHGWSSKGCIGNIESENLLICSCFHLTDFSAILVPTRQVDLPTYGKLSLSPFRNSSQFCLLPFIIVSSLVFLAFWAALYGYILDSYALRRRAPALKRSLFDRGYLQSSILKNGARSTSLFFELWKRKIVHLFATQHGIVCLFWNYPNEMIDRPAKFSCVFVYVLCVLTINIVFFEQVGFLDKQFLSVGFLAGFALVPVYPILSGIFKISLKKKSKDKKSSRKRHGNKIFGQEPKLRQPRIEVAANIETFDGGNKFEPFESTAGHVPPRRKEAQSSLRSLTIPGVPEKRGIRTPDEFAISRPRASSTSIQALSGALERPPSLPPIRSAFEQVADREEGIPMRREVKRRKRSSKSSALPKKFYYLLYVPVVTAYALSMFTSLVLGSSMQQVTIKAWIYATVVSFLFEFLIAQPAWLCFVASIYARTRILQASQVMNRHRLNPKIFAEDVHARMEPEQPSPGKQDLTREKEDFDIERLPSSPPAEARDSPENVPSLSRFQENLGKVVESLLQRSDSGKITFKLFEAVLLEYDLSIDSTFAKSIWEKFASHDTSEANVSDLISALSTRRSDQLLFKLFESCMDRHIHQCLLNDLRQKLTGFMPEVYISILLKDIDFDSDGYVSYDEIRTGYSSLLWFIQSSNEEESEGEVDTRVLEQLQSAVDRTR